MRPVWWAPIGRRALANGFDYRSVGGGFYVLGGQTLSRIGQQGFIDWFDELRFRFVSSEEDLMITLMTCACKNPVYELRDANPDWSRLTVNRNVSIPMRQLGHGFFGDFEGVRLVSCCDPAVVLGVARGLTGRVVGGVIDEASCVGMLACSHSARGS